MNGKIIIAIGALIVVAGGYLIINNQKAAIREIPNLATSEIGNTTDTPIEQAKIAQITLSISSPVDNSTTTSSKISVSGKTLPKAEIYANEAEGFADGIGNFSLQVNLDEGVNEIIVTAVDSEGNVAETVVTVNYNME